MFDLDDAFEGVTDVLPEFSPEDLWGRVANPLGNLDVIQQMTSSALPDVFASADDLLGGLGSDLVPGNLSNLFENIPPTFSNLLPGDTGTSLGALLNGPESFVSGLLGESPLGALNGGPKAFSGLTNGIENFIVNIGGDGAEAGGAIEKVLGGAPDIPKAGGIFDALGSNSFGGILGGLGLDKAFGEGGFGGILGGLGDIFSGEGLGSILGSVSGLITKLLPLALKFIPLAFGIPLPL